MICEKAIKKKATSIILLHNHPSGTVYPSDDDIRLSRYLRDLLSAFGISLVDHVIVGGRYYFPIFEGEARENKLPVPKAFSYGNRTENSGVRLGDPDAAFGIPCFDIN